MVSAPLRRPPHVLFAACLALIVRGERLTFNGCLCKKTWSDEDSNLCSDYCCNPGGGIFWCEVEDTSCEDATWGWCLEAGTEDTQNAVHIENCEDHAWHDLDGDDCLAYGVNQWCTQDGKVGQGWHEEWGNLLEFRANGNSAFKACCACGGGTKGASNPNSQRFTYGGCRCRKNWDEQGLTCPQSCCNPDSDPAGSWCVVEDELCESSDWGYCRPEGDAGGEVGSGGVKHGHCMDSQGWEDLDHETCEVYAAMAYCTEVGGVGLGWNMDWGNFGQFVAPGILPANKACCACGGGTRDDAARPSDGTDPNKVRTTLSDCECRKEWTLDEFGGCDHYCCNPDEDQIGSWCIVADESCEESDWGYCRESGLGFLDAAPRGPLQDAVHCEDAKGWADQDGDSCTVYSAGLWCTASGGAGIGWHEEWGPVTKTALKSCCACGGGSLPTGDEESMSETLLSAAQTMLSEEEADHMWWVASGPCKLHPESGCIVSGNFPMPYGAGEQCQIGIQPDRAKPIHVFFFETERRYDVMKVNGETYSGNRAPNGIVPESTIYWGTDSKDQRGGWMLCSRGDVAKKNPVARVLKVLGVIIVILFCGCCGAFAGLWIRTHNRMPHGDGLGAGPAKTIGKYAAQQDA